MKAVVYNGPRDVQVMDMIVDRHKDRLRLAEKIGAIAIDDSKDDPVEMVM